MIFPIGDDQIQGGYKPTFSYLFIFINIGVFVLQSMDPSGFLYITDYGSIPAEITAGVDMHTLLSSMFMHGGFMHLLGNMLFLWVFADNIESVIGNVKFVLFYLLAGVVASYTHILFDPESTIPCVGASGAISGVMGAYLVMFPKSRIKMLFFIRTFYITAFIFLLLYIGQQLLSVVGTIPMFSDQDGTDGGGVAYWAHIGGFVFGVLVGLFLRSDAKKYALMTEKNQVKAAWERFTT